MDQIHAAPRGERRGGGEGRVGGDVEAERSAAGGARSEIEVLARPLGMRGGGEIEAVGDAMQRGRLGRGIVGGEKDVLRPPVAPQADEAGALGLRRAMLVDGAAGLIARLRRDAVAADKREGLVLSGKAPRQREGQEGSDERAVNHDGQALRAGRRLDRGGGQGEAAHCLLGGTKAREESEVSNAKDALYGDGFSSRP